MFTQFSLETKDDKFDLLTKELAQENLIGGRKSAVLADCKDNLVPLVRTTSVFKKATQRFTQVHYDLIEEIKNMIGMPHLKFNNALLEVYNTKYRRMKLHSDQALDLVDDSYICLFTCYNTAFPEEKRELQIKNKETGQQHKITLEHNSIVLFSTETNSKWIHKIVPEEFKRSALRIRRKADELWLGITFRLAKTYIKFIDGIAQLYPANLPLKLANKEQWLEFLKHKGLENTFSEYKYPEIDYTISPGDLLPI